MSHPKRSQKQSHTGRQQAGDISLRSVPRASLFEAGRNCWRVEQADRVSFLIDGEAYFRAFRDAAIKARHCIMILGWDFDSRIRTLIDRESDGFSDRLGEFLHDLLIRRRELHIYVLTWDFHMIYWSEREWWLPSKLAAHRRLHFVKDAAHPLIFRDSLRRSFGSAIRHKRSAFLLDGTDRSRTNGNSSCHSAQLPIGHCAAA